MPSESGPPTAVVLHVRLALPTISEQLQRVLSFFEAEALARSSTLVEGTLVEGAPTAADLGDPTRRGAAVQRLIACVRELRSAYKGDVAADERALEALQREAGGSVSSDRRQQALHVIIGEKRILDQAVEILQALA